MLIYLCQRSSIFAKFVYLFTVVAHMKYNTTDYDYF